MRIYVLVNFFDEDPTLLREMVESLKPLAPEYIITVDGPYEDFPHDRVTSPHETIDALIGAGLRVGAEVVVHEPAQAWEGNEVAKRQKLLDLAFKHDAGLGFDDWFLVMDSDHLVEECDGVREALQQTTEMAAHVSFYEGRCADGSPGSYPARLLMRATPGMRMGRAHYLYELPDGRHHHILDRDSTVPALDLTDKMLVRHRVHERDEGRRDRQRTYYHERDTRGLERTEDEMLDMVEAWHKGAGRDQPLHEYLGMTWDEYKEWVER